VRCFTIEVHRGGAATPVPPVDQRHAVLTRATGPEGGEGWVLWHPRYPGPTEQVGIVASLIDGPDADLDTVLQHAREFLHGFFGLHHPL
jgi:hypothetical protein